MLAALPRTEDQTLQVFILALKLASNEETSPSEELKNYFNSVVSQAKSVLVSNAAAPSKLEPAAIQLAIDMLQKQSLQDLFSGVNDFESLTRDRANSILIQLEPAFAP